MIKKTSSISVILLTTFVLSGCQTLKEMGCAIGPEHTAANNAEDALAEVQGNITRGYAIHYQEQSQPYQETYCAWRNAYGCTQYAQRTKYNYSTVEVPVSIDIDEEKKKLPVLQDRARTLRERANAAYQSCIAR